MWIASHNNITYSKRVPLPFIIPLTQETYQLTSTNARYFTRGKYSKVKGLNLSIIIKDSENISKVSTFYQWHVQHPLKWTVNMVKLPGNPLPAPRYW